ncbi:MAG: aminotransferase class V-fold PLP-dependent enzyme [Bryobacterales bacterium]|nr:aminotransferase class V-fold PLP-dependent enzyme [Bryobacterales bacterium]
MSSSSRIDQLRNRVAPLEMTQEQFRALGHHLIDRIADFLASVPTRPVTPCESPEEVRAAFGAACPLPETGKDAGALLEQASDLIFEHSLLNGHPRFFGYITSSAAPIGMLADLLAASVNANAGAWKLAPVATEIEVQVVRWLARFIGYPANCGGLLVSGGNMANLTCFLAARAAQAGWDVRKRGVSGGPPLRAYASSETHTWIQKAADLAGLGTDAIRWIATDPRQRIDLRALEAAWRQDVEEGYRPFFVAGSAGTVSTGAVDPLPDLAAFSKERNLWLHVDGAYGAFASAIEDAPADLAGLRLADSVAVDPHKWLYAPLEAGCALVRDANALRNAFSYHPPYYSFGQEATNYFDIGPQNSRGFRALKVWLALQQAGAEGYREMIEDDIALARHLYELALAHPDLQALTHHLSITTLRYVPVELRAGVGSTETEEYLNQLNQRLMAAIEESGEAFVSNAVINGTFALRFCIVNFRTSTADIEAMPQLIARLGLQVHMELSGRGVAQNSVTG